MGIGIKLTIPTFTDNKAIKAKVDNKPSCVVCAVIWKIPTGPLRLFKPTPRTSFPKESIILVTELTIRCVPYGIASQKEISLAALCG